MNFNVIWKLLVATYTKWTEDHAQRLGAALAFYTVFSLAPVLLIVIAVGGLVFGQEAAEGQIIGEIQDLVGEDSAKAIQGMLAYARRPASSMIATGLALITLLVGATSVFAQVQDALNTIWGVKARPGLGIIQILKNRFISFLAVLGSGFLLLVSLVLSAGLAGLGKMLEAFLPASEFVLQAMNFLLSFVVITILFATIYKLIPDVSNRWQDVWVGAAMTSFLFAIGKFLIGLYLGKSDVGLAYGAAGSLIVILLWVYYASQIFLFGAEFTAVYATSHGSQFKPTQNAMPVYEGAMAAPDGASRPPRKVA